MHKTKLVNWQEDMKISPLHLMQTENHFTEEMAGSRAVFITKNDFGLLPLKDANNNSKDIEIREHVTNHIEVVLLNCNAITASGEKIDFNPSHTEQVLSKIFSVDSEKNKDAKDNDSWDVILSVDPYTRIVSGEIDPMGDPLKHPHCAPSYKLDIVASGQLNLSAFGSHFITIGKIHRNEGRFEIDSTYIPPCRNMSSHPTLVEYFDHFGKMFSSLHKSAQDIIAKVNEKSGNNAGQLAGNIAAMSETMLQYLQSIRFTLKNVGKGMSPIAVTEHICVLAAHCYTCLLCLPSVQKEEMLKYFFEWSDITPGSLQEMIATTMEMDYKHDQIRSVMVRLNTFLNTINGLWERLSRLEYIGQHKESLVISARGGEDNKKDERRGYFITN